MKEKGYSECGEYSFLMSELFWGEEKVFFGKRKAIILSEKTV